jgi:hypothetical protein
MLVSKIQTLISDKMHLKKVITKKHAKLGLYQKKKISMLVQSPVFKSQVYKLEGQSTTV